MTVQAVDPSDRQIASPGATVFTYPFKIRRASDLLVRVDGVTKALGVDYSVDGITAPEGDVTFFVPMVGGELVQLDRAMPYDRATDYQNLGDLRSATLNNDQDDPVMMIQQVAWRQRFMAQFPDSVDPNTYSPFLPVPDQPLYILRANPAANAYELAEPPEIATVADGAITDDKVAPGAGIEASKLAYTLTGAGGVERAISARLDDMPTVTGLGATPGGGAADTAAFQAAATRGGVVYVPTGKYNVVGAITAGLTPARWVGEFTSEADLPLNLPGVQDGWFQNQKFIYQSAAGASDVNTMQVRRDVNYTGGTVGFLNKALSAYSVVNTTANPFECAFFAEQDNYSTGGQNFAMGSQARKRAAGSAWALVTETHEMNAAADPAQGTIGYEANIFANGTDVLGNRNVIAIICKRKNPAGAVASIGYGISITCSSDDIGGVKYDKGIALGRSGIVTDFGVGIDMRFATFTAFGIAMWLANDQAIAFNTAADRRLTYIQGAGRLRYQAGGGGQVFDFLDTGTLALTGTIEILGGQVVTSRRPGWAAPTGTITRSTFNTATVTTAQLAERVYALINDLSAGTGHGLIGA